MGRSIGTASKRRRVLCLLFSNLAELTIIFFISYSNWKVCALYAVIAPTILVVLIMVAKIA